MMVKEFFDKATFTLSYVVYNPDTFNAVLIDPILNYDGASSKISTKSVEEITDFIFQKKLNPLLVLETHIHADHMSGAQELKKRFPAVKLGIGAKITSVQETFAKIFNFSNFGVDGRQFDFLFKDNELLEIGGIYIRVLSTPGHTPACSSYIIDGMVFTGDALFMPDFGTGRCDFPDGDAGLLYDSIMHKLYKLPDSTKVFTGHDYLPGGRNLKYESSIGEQKEKNIHIKIDTSREEFIIFRNNRDKMLAVPNLLLPSIQVNINGGILPKPEDNGISYLKIPIA